jgi:hypothetical protein
MPPRRNPDLFGNLLLLGVVVAGGVWLARTVHLPVGLPPGGPPVGTPQPGGGGNQWSPINAAPGGNGFNVNTAESFWSPESGISALTTGVTIRGHVGVGHIGPGGDFQMVLWADNTGILGFGASGAQQILSQTFHTNSDADWTGYGVDFQGVPLGAAAGAGHTNVWAQIIGLSGEWYTQAPLRLA